MRVVITRPAGDAHAWRAAVQNAGREAVVLPLIEVGLARQAEPTLQAWAQWPQWQAVMFVSAQAVRYFFERQPAHTRTDAGNAAGATWANGPRCWATGPGTHQALLQAGVPEACIDSPCADAVQFDSEALWARVASHLQANKPVLIVRGHDVLVPPQTLAQASPRENGEPTNGTGRDWLAQQLQAAGALVQFVVAYERRLPLWSAEQVARARQSATDGSVWCFSSSQAIQHLAQLCPKQDWSSARCIATHARIAQAAQALGFGEIHGSRPSVADVLGSLECLA